MKKLYCLHYQLMSQKFGVIRIGHRYINKNTLQNVIIENLIVVLTFLQLTTSLLRLDSPHLANT